MDRLANLARAKGVCLVKDGFDVHGVPFHRGTTWRHISPSPPVASNPAPKTRCLGPTGPRVNGMRDVGAEIAVPQSPRVGISLSLTNYVMFSQVEWVIAMCVTTNLITRPQFKSQSFLFPENTLKFLYLYSALSKLGCR